jgi:molybdenum cofactor biosynthesis enzyme MoaA
MELFGKEIPIKTHNCSLNGGPPLKKDREEISLYVRFKGCNANCLFCEYKNDAFEFDLKKYEEVLNHLKSKIWVYKINLTGGEPTVQWKLFKTVLNITRNAFPASYVVLNTNGYRLDRVFQNSSVASSISNISLSRHHYKDNVNQDILGTLAPSSKLIKEINSKAEKWKFHLTCNLIKDYIDSKAEAYKYLDWASGLGLPSASFVSLMPINRYCKDNFIDFKDLNLESDKFISYKEWNYEDKCSCVNWMYLPDNAPNPIKVYSKNTCKPLEINTSLVFDGQNVKTGFSENIIF